MCGGGAPDSSYARYLAEIEKERLQFEQAKAKAEEEVKTLLSKAMSTVKDQKRKTIRDRIAGRRQYKQTERPNLLKDVKKEFEKIVNVDEE